MAVARALAVCALYVLLGKIGLSLALVHASASSVWPPTGIALAALLVLGTRMWPAIFVGALVVNVTTSGALVTSLAIAAGNTVEALLGAEIVTRFARGRRFVDRAQDFIRFTALAGLLATAVSATIGVSALVLGGEADPDRFGPIWLTWWLGDAAGAVIVTPPLVAWANSGVRLNRRRVLEGLALALTFVVAAVVVFGGGWLGLPVRNHPLAFVMLPPLMWAAFRFGPRVAATMTLALAGIAVWGTLREFGPFVLMTDNASLLLLQVFLSTITVTTLAVAAAVAERARASAEVVAANRAKDEFLAVLSHELRTPLNAIVGWASMLRSGKLDAPTVDKALTTIERNAQVQAHLIEDLLDISRIVVGQVKLAREVVSLHGVVTAAVDAQRPMADTKGIRLDVRVDEVTVQGDPTRLGQVMSNLVSNAIKFTPAGKEVHVALERARDIARITVTDTGTGISPEFLPHLFERFRQADEGSRRLYGGLGIGLAIVRHLVELHGGSVRGESRGKEKGATFVVDLPVYDKG